MRGLQPMQDQKFEIKECKGANLGCRSVSEKQTAGKKGLTKFGEWAYLNKNVDIDISSISYVGY